MTEENILIQGEELKKLIRDSASKPNSQACLIFGAGASYGYSKEHFYKPPVVRDLFNDSNNVVNQVINRPENIFIKNNKSDYTRDLRNYENDLERYLSSFYAQNKEDNLFGRFLQYLEDIFFLASEDVITDSTNNYRTIINLMWSLYGKGRWSCLSFNYDTILEKSYLIADRDTTEREFNSSKSYTGLIPAIVKMHGSINFRYIFRKPFIETDQKTHTTHALFSKMMSDKSSSKDFLRIIGLRQKKPNFYSYQQIMTSEKKIQPVSHFDFPLMLIPIHASINPENVFFQEQLELAKRKIKNSNLIISIGYNFGDEAFIDNLSSLDFLNKEIILVDMKSAFSDTGKYSAFQRISKKWGNAKIKIFDGNGFDEFMDAV